MPTTNVDGSSVTAAHLLILVEQAERIRTQIAADAVIARTSACVLDGQSSSEPTQIHLGSCCRLVHWALIQASNALEPLTNLAGDAPAMTPDAYAATCEEQRQLLLWSVATLTAVRQLMAIACVGDHNLPEEHASLGALSQSLDFSAVALATLKKAAVPHITTEEGSSLVTSSRYFFLRG